jgi:hypothetical protein
MDLPSIAAGHFGVTWSRSISFHEQAFLQLLNPFLILLDRLLIIGSVILRGTRPILLTKVHYKVRTRDNLEESAKPRPRCPNRASQKEKGASPFDDAPFGSE